MQQNSGARGNSGIAKSALTAVLVPVLATALAAVLVTSWQLHATAVPAAAANSAASLLDPSGDRLFSGADRYATAVALADQLVASRGSAGDLVDTVVLAAGDRGAPDAAAASGLAGVHNAAILLTGRDRLHPLVGDFIARNTIQDVIVLGGTEAISDEVIAQLDALDLSIKPEVTRLAGSDRVQTSLAVARSLIDPGEFCDTNQPSVILINAASLVDAALVAPLAYRANLAVIFTNPDVLPAVPDSPQAEPDSPQAEPGSVPMEPGSVPAESNVLQVAPDSPQAEPDSPQAEAESPQAEASALEADTAQYLSEARIEHILIMGSAAEISDETVAAALTASSAQSTRVDAADPIARSAQLARILQQCNAVPVSSRTFALADSRQPLDAAVAGPALGAGLGVGQTDATALVPILLVDDTLPSEVSLLLEEIPRRNADESFVSAQLVAIGGTERVSDAVLEAALDAAVNSPELTARINAVAGTSTVTVLFSEEVTDETPAEGEDLAAFDVKNINNYLVADEALVSVDRITTNGLVATIELDNYVIQAGDTIEVLSGVIKGAGEDNRTVRGVRVLIKQREPDTRRPLLSLELAENAPAFVVLVDEANPFGANSRALQIGDIKVTRSDGENVPLATGEGAADGLSYLVALQAGLVLEADDEVRVESGALRDADGRASRAIKETVPANSDSPRVLAAVITEAMSLVEPGPDGLVGSLDDVVRDANLQVVQDADGTWVACPPDATPDAGDSPGATPGDSPGAVPGADPGAVPDDCEPEFELRARPLGREAGVAGNHWSLQLFYDPDADIVENGAAVSLSTSRSIVSVTYGDEARVSDVIKALRSEDAVVSRFEILDANEASDPLMQAPEASPPEKLDFVGGASRVEITLTYNEVLARFNGIGGSTTTSTARPAEQAANQDADPNTGQNAEQNTGQNTSTDNAPIGLSSCPATGAAGVDDPRLGGALKAAQSNAAFTGSSPESIVWDIRFDAPSSTVAITLTSSTDLLPTQTDTLVLPTALAVNFDCATSVEDTDRRLQAAR